jgi:phosphate butyryltransferase
MRCLQERGRRWNMSEQTKTVAVVGAAHAESLLCMAELQSEHLVDFLLFGNRNEITELAEIIGVDIRSAVIVPAKDDDEASLLAAEAVVAQTVQVLMKGSVHTSSFVRSILDKRLGLLPSGGILSHVASVTLPWYPKPFLLTDAAINISPDFDRKVVILSNALAIARSLGVQAPKVAVICPVETVNPRIPSTTDAAQLVFLQRNTAVFSDAIVEGPIALDVALSAQAAASKGIGGEVPGQADILLMPNLDAANATLKAFLAAPDAISAGIVVGARIPVVLTSRSEPKAARINSLKLALSVSS